MRLRCKEEWIERSQNLKWWEFPEEVIRNNLDLFKEELTYDVIEKIENIKANLLA